MPRPRTPSKILEIRGAYKINPSRKRNNEPKPISGIGAFIHGPTDLAAIWDEVVAQVVPGVLTNSDRIALELVCRLLAELRMNHSDLPVGKVNALCNLLGRFGLTPADRSKVAAAEEKDDDEWAGFD